MRAEGGCRIRFLGHATVLIELDGVRILTDPVLGPRVGPLIRIASPPAPEHIDGIDIVLVSHAHHDHLDRRYVLDGPVAVLGRSRDCDCVFEDPNISRRHAELRQASNGDWAVRDLGSTNGVKINGRRVDSARLAPGEEVTLVTTSFVFDIEQ